MLTLKKLAAVAVLVLSNSAVFAGTMGSVCDVGHATTSCEGTAWDFGARALYLVPAYSGGDYRYAAVDNAAGSYEDFNQNWGWGFFLEGSYHYNTGSDANLNWYHFSKSMRKVFSGDFDFFGDREAESGISSIEPKWDALNLEFGQSVKFGENKNIRFHGGFQYARITIVEKLIGANPTDLHDASDYEFRTKSTFNGVGARVGADMGCDLGHNVGVYSNVAAAILGGHNKISNKFVDNTGIPFRTSAYKRAMAPELEAKLGVKYDYGMAMGDLTFDLAWMWINYFNATQVIPSDFITKTTPQVLAGDIGFQGIFFGLHWLGNGF